MKINKLVAYSIILGMCLSLVHSGNAFAASTAKQLAKGISLYESNKDDAAMDYFMDVLVSGTADEVATANKYIDLIHNRIGGIQNPVEVDINFKEGEVKRLEELASMPGEAMDKVSQTPEMLEEKLNETVDDLKEPVETFAQDIYNDAKNATEDLDKKLQSFEDKLAEEQANFADEPFLEDNFTSTPERDAMLTSSVAEESNSVFADLTSPDAIQARELYTQQKIDSMKAAAIAKIADTKGVHLYFRDDKPDAIDIEPEVLFEKGKFKTEALPLLNSIYELLALTQGASYVILPEGSYTDDVTLPGIKQAMALNSYLISRGISQGKLQYNMGLVEQEPPARFSNLMGLGIVFDYDAKLPTNLLDNADHSQLPLLSIAVVPTCHAIDRSLGEAFAIDFSVIETATPIDNWVLQVVQHGRDGKYYIVRQLEGFAPVYHQILWNGRKGIIGPELPCGKYTLVLTATDLKGEKQTFRRRLIVKCSDQVTTCQTGTCGETVAKVIDANDLCPTCDYKASRLWTKPARTMGQKTATAKATSTSTSSSTSTSTVTKKVTNTTKIIEDDFDMPATPTTTSTTTTTTTTTNGYDDSMVNNPYDMPYDDLN